MEKILDRLILFVCCSIFLFNVNIDIYTVIPLMFMVICVSVNVAYDKSVVHMGTFVISMCLTFLCSDITFFIPLLCYDFYTEPYKYVSLLSVIVIYINFDNMEFISVVWMVALLILAFLMKMRTSELLRARQEVFYIKDELIEKAESLKIKNRELLERQDYEISNATLNERNRIAREIHDTVGHLLSSSILQIGALIAISKDDMQKQYLSQIKDTLTQGMDSIRHSIHNIHEESMELESKLKDIISSFTFCEVSFNYKIKTEFSMKAKYTIVFIIKEALANVAKHSNATLVNIVFAELPGFYRIIIENDGKSEKKNQSDSSGMGVAGMIERITSLDGNINISRENGYKIYITLPREVAMKKEE